MVAKASQQLSIHQELSESRARKTIGSKLLALDSNLELEKLSTGNRQENKRLTPTIPPVDIGELQQQVVRGYSQPPPDQHVPQGKPDVWALEYNVPPVVHSSSTTTVYQDANTDIVERPRLIAEQHEVSSQHFVDPLSGRTLEQHHHAHTSIAMSHDNSHDGNNHGAEALNRIEALRQEFQSEFPPILDEIRKDNLATNQRVAELGDALSMLIAKLDALSPALEARSHEQPSHQMSHQGPSNLPSTKAPEKTTRPSRHQSERGISVPLSSMDSGDDSPPNNGDSVDMKDAGDSGSTSSGEVDSDLDIKRSSTTHFTFKVPDEKFGGDYRKLQSWLFNLDEYFSKARIQKSLRVDITTSVMVGDATMWWRILRQQNEDPRDWKTFQKAIRDRFLPLNSYKVTRNKLERLRQSTSVTQYNSAFQAAFVECTDVSQAEALRRYIVGLKADTSDHVDLLNPKTLRQAMQIAEDYDNHKFNRSRQNADRQSTRSSDSSNHKKHKFKKRFDKDNRQDNSRQSDNAERKNKLSWEDAKSEGRCVRCRQEGHIKAQCPLNKKAKN